RGARLPRDARPGYAPPFALWPEDAAPTAVRLARPDRRADVKIYEGMFILHNRELPEGEVADPQEVVRALISKCGGETAHTLLWANRKLAYPIEGNQPGTYVLAYFPGEPDTCSKLNREVAISDRCLRPLAIAIEELPAADALPGPLSEPVVRPARRPEEGEEG